MTVSQYLDFQNNTCVARAAIIAVIKIVVSHDALCDCAFANMSPTPAAEDDDCTCGICPRWLLVETLK